MPRSSDSEGEKRSAASPARHRTKQMGEGNVRIAGRALAGCVIAVAVADAVSAAEMRGVTATEIKIGQTMPYSGPVSPFGALGEGDVGYFKMLIERGGINGRKVNLISLDDPTRRRRRWSRRGGWWKAMRSR